MCVLGGDTLRFSYIRRLVPFFWSNILNFNIFEGFSGKMNMLFFFFWGGGGGHCKNFYVFRVHVFSKSQGAE